MSNAMPSPASSATPDRRPLLRAMFDAAIAAAQPALCLAAHLPEPPTRGGRTIVIGAGQRLLNFISHSEGHTP
jgi:glycerate 2-kinase